MTKLNVYTFAMYEYLDSYQQFLFVNMYMNYRIVKNMCNQLCFLN